MYVLRVYSLHAYAPSDTSLRAYRRVILIGSRYGAIEPQTFDIYKMSEVQLPVPEHGGDGGDDVGRVRQRPQLQPARVRHGHVDAAHAPRRRVQLEERARLHHARADLRAHACQHKYSVYYTI